MPRNYRAAGSFKANGWEKMIKGKRMRIHCGDLGLPEERWNQDDSYQAAAAHWEKMFPPKQTAIEQATDQIKAVLAQLGVDGLQRLIEQGQAAGQLNEIVGTISQDNSVPLSAIHLPADFAPWNGELPLPKLPSDQERVNHVKQLKTTVLEGKAVTDELTIGKQFDAWKTLQLATKKSPARKKMNIQMLDFFIRFMGEKAPLDAIDENCWERYWHHLSTLTYTKGKSEERHEYDEGYKGRVQAQARSFIKWLDGKMLIRLPRNLNDPNLVFEEEDKAIEEISLRDVRKFYAGATGQTRLHILLMLNCGFNGIDISELKRSEIDWKRGTITRKRSKLRKLKKSKAKKAPVVTYKLWDETFRLLKEYDSKTDPVLLTVNGNPWIKNGIDEESYSNGNNIASNFRWLRKKTGAKITTKNCRTAAATTLGKGPYKAYGEYFLGETPSGTASKFYIPEDDEEFFEALSWLEKQIGVTI